MSTTPNHVAYYRGQPLAELSLEQLIECINHLAREVETLRQDRESIRPHIDWASYLTSK